VVVPPNQFESVEWRPHRMLYIDMFEEVEREENPDAPLAKMMRSSTCEMAELIEGYYGWSRFPAGNAERLGRLVLGDLVEWEDVRALYLKSPEATAKGNGDKG
jgi:hypothetical protein